MDSVKEIITHQSFRVQENPKMIDQNLIIKAPQYMLLGGLSAKTMVEFELFSQSNKNDKQFLEYVRKNGRLMNDHVTTKEIEFAAHLNMFPHPLQSDANLNSDYFEAMDVKQETIEGMNQILLWSGYLAGNQSANSQSCVESFILNKYAQSKITVSICNQHSSYIIKGINNSLIAVDTLNSDNGEDIAFRIAKILKTHQMSSNRFTIDVIAFLKTDYDKAVAFASYFEQCTINGLQGILEDGMNTYDGLAYFIENYYENN